MRTDEVRGCFFYIETQTMGFKQPACFDDIARLAKGQGEVGLAALA